MTQLKTGFLFPGQGAQFVGMGKELYDNHPEACQVFEEADRLLGYSISRICFEGPEAELTRTLHAQPAIFVTSMAALAVLRSRFPDLKPSFSAGLSLGEFTALTACGAIAFEDGLKLVQTRAEAMEEAAKNNPGTMASIMGLEQSECEAAAKEAGCEVANLNSPDQIVVSGTVESIDRVCPLAEERGAKRAIKLKVGGAFHSTLMAQARERLKSALAGTQITLPSCLFIPNAKGSAAESTEEIRDLLARQLTSPVRWIETMACAKGADPMTFIEIGPGKVLKGLARKCDRELEVTAFGTPADMARVEERLQAVSTKES